MELYSIATVVFDANTAQQDHVVNAYFDINFNIVRVTVSQERLTAFGQALFSSCGAKGTEAADARKARREEMSVAPTRDSTNAAVLTPQMRSQVFCGGA